MAGFGMGLGAFLSGAVEGAKTYESIKDMRALRQAREVETKTAEAEFNEKQRNDDLKASADRIGAQSLEFARQKYGDDMAAVMKHYYEDAIPKQQEWYIANGKPEAAETLGKFMQTQQAQELTANTAQAIKLAYMGDYASMGPSIQNVLNISNKLNGAGAGYTYKSFSEDVDDKGVKTGGITFTVTGPDGKDQQIGFKNSSELVGFLRNTGMPDAVVKQAYADEDIARAARAEAAKSSREFKQKLQEKSFDHKIKRNEMILGSNLRRDEATHAGDVEVSVAGRNAEIKDAYGLNDGGNDANSKVIQAQRAAAYLQQWGYTDEEIRDAIPALLGVQNRSKDPQVQLQETIKMLASSDPNFADLSATEKVARARELIAAMNGGSQPAGAGVGVTKNPFIDNKTGEVVYR